MERVDVCVRGGGAVGRSLALALSRQGLSVGLQGLAERPGATGNGDAGAPRDVRAYALNPQSVALLRDLKVWDALPEDAATAVHEMQVQGDAPAGTPLRFSAWEQQVEALAWIVDAAALEDALAAALRFAPHVTLLGDRPVQAELTALCEGRDAAGRAEHGVQWDCHAYGQRGVAGRLVAERPHQGTAHQWFRAPDVLGVLPFDRPERGRSWGFVWSLPDERAEALLHMDDAAFEQALQEATGGALGPLKLAGPRAAWPLAIARATPLCGPGWVLLGDAAHLVHPLAGQGLNLGLGDVAALAQVIRERESWRPLGDERLLRRYARQRLVPTWAMGQVTDGLLHLFSHPAPWLKELRNRGLGLVDSVRPVKRWLASRALGH